MSEVQTGGEPFEHPGGEVGCLLLHGFTGSPDEMRLLGEHLAGRGYSVMAPRLFGHGTNVQDMNRARYRDWIANAEDGYHLLSSHCDTVFALGLSMGACLSLLLSRRAPLAGVVAMSTPIKLPDDPRLPFARLLSLLWPRVDKPRSHRHADEDWPPTFAYDYYPTRAVAELAELLARMRSELPRVAAPVLLLHAHDDSAVSPAAMDQIERALGAAEVATCLIERSGHLIPVDEGREQTFARIEDFLQRMLQQRSS